MFIWVEVLSYGFARIYQPSLLIFVYLLVQLFSYLKLFLAIQL
jgi:hypothetical protein